MRRVPSTAHSGRSFQLFVDFCASAADAPPELGNDEQPVAHDEHEEEERELDADERPPGDQDGRERERRPEHEQAVATHGCDERRRTRTRGIRLVSHVFPHASHVQRSP